MIDKKLLIDLLELEINKAEERGYYSIGMDLKTAKVIARLLKQPKVGEWIPVEERLPKHDGEYLIQAINDCEGIYIAVSSYDSQYKSFSSDGVEDDNAIAWMDLPKMYEVKE